MVRRLLVKAIGLLITSPHVPVSYFCGVTKIFFRIENIRYGLSSCNLPAILVKCIYKGHMKFLDIHIPFFKTWYYSGPCYFDKRGKYCIHTDKTTIVKIIEAMGFLV